MHVQEELHAVLQSRSALARSDDARPETSAMNNTLSQDSSCGCWFYLHEKLIRVLTSGWDVETHKTSTLLIDTQVSLQSAPN